MFDLDTFPTRLKTGFMRSTSSPRFNEHSMLDTDESEIQDTWFTPGQNLPHSCDPLSMKGTGAAGPWKAAASFLDVEKPFWFQTLKEKGGLGV